MISQGVFFRVEPDPEFEITFDQIQDLKILEAKAPEIQVLVADNSTFSDSQFESTFQSLRATNPRLVFILLVGDHQVSYQQIARYAPSLVLQKQDLKTGHLLWALNEVQNQRQRIELEKLVQSQKIQLEKLYLDLEDRVEKRQKFLIEAKQRTHLAQKKWEALKQALIVSQRAVQLSQMEAELCQVLTQALQIDHLRILFYPQDTVFYEQIKNKTVLSFCRTPLTRAQEKDIFGQVFFFRKTDQPFQRSDIDFLNRVSEVISLSVDRLNKIKQSEQIKEQWETTFNSVSDPLILLNQDFDILQSNQAFQNKVKKSARDLAGKKCFAVFFNRGKPCVGCQQGKIFRIQNESEFFDVFSHQIQSKASQKSFVHHYQDVSQKVQIEKKIMEKSQLAELGAIGSSIAHELNNPLGGILNYVQLLKMDFGPQDPIFEDLQEMEKAIKKCQERTQNLLQVSRDKP